MKSIQEQMEELKTLIIEYEMMAVLFRDRLKTKEDCINWMIEKRDRYIKVYDGLTTESEHDS